MRAGLSATQALGLGPLLKMFNAKNELMQKPKKDCPKKMPQETGVMISLVEYFKMRTAWAMYFVAMGSAPCQAHSNYWTRCSCYCCHYDRVFYKSTEN